jgi:S1-C subfamily serine protease
MRSGKVNSNSLIWVSVVLVLLSFEGAVMVAQATEQFVVNCFDEALDTVQKKLSADCNGKVVTDEEAADIRRRRSDHIRRALSRPSASEVPGKRLTGIGSGFFVAKDGIVLTNHHVVKDCTVVSVSTTGGQMATANSVVSDKLKDLALVRVDLKASDVASFATGMSPGMSRHVALVGYPDQGIPPIRPMLTNGEMLPAQETSWASPVIVIKADVRRGNSGGPLLDQQGNVIGVVFAKINTVSVAKQTGAVMRDIGFALPTKLVLSFLDGQGIEYRTNRASSPVARDALLKKARPYMTRIGCWK